VESHQDRAYQWTNPVEDAPLSEFLKLLNEEVEESYSTIRNYSGLNTEQREHEDIRRNKEQVQSLRGEIEQAHINCQLLEKKYREAVNKDEKLDMVEMKERLRELEEQLEGREQELKMLKFEYRDYTLNMSAQKEKIKELETDLEAIKGVEMKKLKEIEMLQFTLTEEVSRIGANMNSFGSMFEFESEGKRSLAQTIISHKDKIEKMAVILGRHKNDNQSLRQEIQRLNLVIIELGLEVKALKKD
jgi:chromosome segregation ATPase